MVNSGFCYVSSLGLVLVFCYELDKFNFEFAAQIIKQASVRFTFGYLLFYIVVCI